MRTFERAIAPIIVWLWARKRIVLEAWLLLWVCALIVDFSPIWWLTFVGLVKGMLEAIIPGHELILIGSPSSPTPTRSLPLNSWEILLAESPQILGLYFGLALPLLLLVRSSDVLTALGPFDPRTMEAIIRLLRMRARTFKLWAACSVLLLVATLCIGVLMFSGADVTFRFDEKDVENVKTIKLELIQDTNSLLSSVSRRVGAIVMLVFLVTILVHMYRDNIKQATFYDRWADALQLAGTNSQELKQFIDLFFLEWLEFDKPPRSPVEQLAQALRGVQNQLQKRKD